MQLRDLELVRPPQGNLPPTARLNRSSTTQQLDGSWAFTFDPTGRRLFDPTDAGEGWGSVDVPGHWQLQGYGAPAYTNIRYPFPIDPPLVPTDVPTGHYRTRFSLAPLAPGERVILGFDGVDSWCEVWLNGVRLGDGSGSRLTLELDATHAARSGENVLAVRVAQWSFASYIEDQDQWWLSGIFRSVHVRIAPPTGIDDVRVLAEWNHLTSTASLRLEVDSPISAAVEIPELGIAFAAGEQLELQGVEPWSAEHPRLYDVVVATDSESVRLRIGFRTVAIVDGVLTCNGRPLVFHGVNRHDFDPRHGRAVSADRIRADLLTMKAHNVDAVRTSHYPPSPVLLDLCDELGLWVMEECDLETHGFSEVDWRANPTDDPDWREVLVDRVRRMVSRDRNHPSVVVWSLGNEAGWGENIRAMAGAVRSLDGTRPLHYEQDAEALVVDMVSRMYPTLEELEAYAVHAEPALDDPAQDAVRRGLPMVMCEYAHAMGNGPGGLDRYQRIVDSSDRLCGGFVWEWFDHGLAVERDDGQIVYRYGGDFGEAVHDGNFVIDGLVLPDGTPSPGLVEVAAVFAPVRMSILDDAVEIRNGWMTRTTESVSFTWSAAIDGELVSSRELVVPLIAAGESITVSLPPTPRGAVVTVLAADRRVRPWAPEGQVVGQAQGAIVASPPPPSSASPVRVEQTGYSVGGASFDSEGVLRRLFNHPVSDARVDFWRVPTDNDRFRGLSAVASRLEEWQAAGLDLMQRRVMDIHANDRLTVRSRYGAPGLDSGFMVDETWWGDEGSVEYSLVATRLGANIPIPRLDLLLGIPVDEPGEVAISWLGLGPGEAYPDSRSAPLFGRHRSTVSAMQTPYIVPQENGCRLDTSWSEVSLPGGALQVHAHERVTFTTRPWSDRELSAARHRDELGDGETLWLRWGAGIDGLGSAACGPAPAPDDTFHPDSAALRLRFSR